MGPQEKELKAGEPRCCCTDPTQTTKRVSLGTLASSCDDLARAGWSMPSWARRPRMAPIPTRTCSIRSSTCWPGTRHRFASVQSGHSDPGCFEGATRRNAMTAVGDCWVSLCSEPHTALFTEENMHSCERIEFRSRSSQKRNARCVRRFSALDARIILDLSRPPTKCFSHGAPQKIRELVFA